MSAYSSLLCSEVGINQKQFPVALKQTKNTFDHNKKNQTHRNTVLEYFKQFSVGKSALLSMPGQSWSFEDSFLSAFKDAKFTGIERHLETFLKAGMYAPGRSGNFRGINTPNCVLDAYCNSRSVLFRAELYDLLTISRAFSCKPKLKGQHREWFSIKKRHTHIWFDTCSTLSMKTLTALSLIDPWVWSEVKRLPLAVTFVRGRDGFNADEQRREVIQSAVRSIGVYSVKLEDWINYNGIGGSPMTMCLMSCERIKRLRLGNGQKRSFFSV